MKHDCDLTVVKTSISKDFPMLFRDYSVLIEKDKYPEFGVHKGWSERVINAFYQLEFLNNEFGKKYGQIIQVSYLNVNDNDLRFTISITDHDPIWLKYLFAGISALDNLFGIDFDIHQILDDKFHFNNKVNSCVNYLIAQAHDIISKCKDDCKFICKHCGENFKDNPSMLTDNVCLECQK